MKSENRIRGWQARLVLLALILSAMACAAPMEPVVTMQVETATPNLPAAVSPTAQPPAPTQPPVPTATTAPQANTQPAPAQTISTKAPAQLSEVTIYFVAIGDDGASGPKVGCGDSLVAVKQPVQPTSGVIRAALTSLFSYKQQNIGQSGLYNALWQADLSLADARVENGVATVSLVGKVQMGGECDTPRFKGQIEQTILAQPGVKQAVVILNGKPIDEALSLK